MSAMTNVEQIQLPLYNFFKMLQKNGFPLGLQEYYDLLQALHHTQGIDVNHQQIDQKELLAVCKILWLKPKQSLQVFESLYWETFEDFMPKDKGDSDTETPSQNQTTDTINNGGNEPLNTLPKSETISEESPEQLNKTTKEEETETPETVSENTVTRETGAAYKKLKFVIAEAPETEALGGLEDSIRHKPRKFLRDPYVFKVTPRQMQQICRLLPVQQNLTEGQRLDIDKTVEQYAQQGFFMCPVFKTRTQIRNQVWLLIDQGGSMAAFEQLTHTFSAALRKAFQTFDHTKPSAVTTYYFYNTPHKQVYLDRSRIKAVSLKSLNFEIKQAPQTLIFILSDAGAARGGNSDGRVEATLDFLSLLKIATHKIVWLNPMPKQRWAYTSAERIAQAVPMYALDNKTKLREAINYLKKH